MRWIFWDDETNFSKVNCAHFGLASWSPFQVAQELLSVSLEGMRAAWLIFNSRFFFNFPGGGGNFCIPPTPGSECRLLLGALTPRCCNWGKCWHVRTKGVSLLELPAGFSFSWLLVSSIFALIINTHLRIVYIGQCVDRDILNCWHTKYSL